MTQAMIGGSANVVRYADLRPTPWKNGGGETRQIASDPPDAGLDGFGWRVSLAAVTADGPFSDFPGVDRTLAVVSGAGLLLTVGRSGAMRLDPGAEPHGFPADLPAWGRLVDGPVLNLNVMTRRFRFRHRVVRHALRAAHAVAFTQAGLVFCVSGAIMADGHRLGPRDAWLARVPGRLVLDVTDGAEATVLLAYVEARTPDPARTGVHRHPT